MISISVIIPCYNVENYVEDALRSALDQSLAPLEIICVDDYSTDKTVSIIRNLQEAFPKRIQLYVNDKNMGATYTRNRGLAVARGEYVQFLDADDVLFKNKLEYHSLKIEEAKVKPDILVGSCKKISIDKSEKFLVFKEGDYWCALASSKLGVTSANLFRREKLLEVKGWADGLKSSQEYELMFRLLKKKAVVIFDERVLNINRERASGSITKTNPEEMWKRYIGLRLKIYNYLRDQDDLTEERKQTCINIIFDAIRFLYQYDPKTAIEFHRSYIEGTGKPGVTLSTSGKYLTFYNLLGFRNAQKIARLFRAEPVLN